MICATDIALQFGAKRILHPLSISFQKAEFVAVIGPNGAGKSSLLHVLSGNQQPTAGTVCLDGKKMADWHVQALAKRRAYLHQQHTVFGDFTVREILEMGRFPHATDLRNSEEYRLLQSVLNMLGMETRMHQNYQQLSGGEQQRVQFGRVLLQLHDLRNESMNGKYLFLDEPLNNLDVKYQFALLQQAKSHFVATGGTVVAVLHDINMAYQFADRVLILKHGKLMADDETAVALNDELLSSIFEVTMQKISLQSQQPFFITTPQSVGACESLGVEVERIF